LDHLKITVAKSHCQIYITLFIGIYFGSNLSFLAIKKKSEHLKLFLTSFMIIESLNPARQRALNGPGLLSMKKHLEDDEPDQIEIPVS